MAPKMYPSVPIVGKTSQPEQTIFNELARQLNDDCIVLHSLKTFDHYNKPIAEADFVIVGPQGVLVLEVKGDFRCELGVWHYANDVSSPESPLEQASGCMFAIMRRLNSFLSSDGKADLHRAISFGSGFVSTKRDLPGDMVEIPRELFMGPRKLVLSHLNSLREYVSSVQDYWMKKNTNRRKLTKDEIAYIVRKLRPDVNAPLDAYTNLKLMDGKMAIATEQQQAVLRGALSNPKLLIEGMAGTGKTLLAVNVANSYAAKGMKVLLLCFNDNLSTYLLSTVSDTVTVSTVHKQLRAGTSSAEALDLLKGYEGDRLWREGLPMVFAMLNETKEDEKYDVLIVDEAQDVMTLDFLHALSCMVKGGVNSGNVVLFYDPRQDIFGGLSEEALGYLHKNYFFNYRLTVNCRNTREVAALGSIISEIDIPLNEDLESGRAQNPKFSSKTELVTSVRNLIEELSAQGFPPSDIVVLSPKTLDNSLVLELSQGKSPMLLQWGIAPGSDTKAYYSTIQGFKGLEAGAVIIVDLDLETEIKRQQLLYVGCTRAKTTLCPTFPNSNQRAYEALGNSYGIRLSRRNSQ